MPDARVQRKIEQIPNVVGAYNSAYLAGSAKHKTLENQLTKLREGVVAKEQEIRDHVDKMLADFTMAFEAMRIQIDDNKDVVPAVLKLSEDEFILAIGDNELLFVRPGDKEAYHYYGAPDPVTGVRLCLTCPIPHQITWRDEPVAPIPRA